jgi:TP901 family phage tail tape measure protein
MALAETARLLSKVEMDTRNFMQGVQTTERGLGRMESRFKRIGSHAKTGLGNAANNIKRFGLLAAGAGVAGLTASVKLAADFDDAMTKSLAIMGNVSDEMRSKMSSAAREVAKTSEFSANQAAEAYFFLASAGLDAEQQLAAMPKVAKFAAAGNFDLATATDLLTDAQSALGLTIRDDAIANMNNMVRVSDVLVKANVLANASVEQFSQSLTNKAGAALKTLGKDLEEGVAVLAAFADQGVKGQTAGTALAIILRDLQTASIKNKDTWKELGVSVFDTNGEMRNMGEIVGDLEGLLKGMSDRQKKVTLAQLGFTDKSQGFLLTLLGSADAIKAYEKELRKAGGTTDEVAAKQLASFTARLNILKNNLKDVGITIGNELIPTLQELADEATAWLQAHPGEIERFAKQIGEGFKSAVAWAKSLDWAGIGNSLKVAAGFAKGVVDAFLAMPDWVKQAVVTGWGLNKLTGGAVVKITGEITGGVANGLVRGFAQAGIGKMFVQPVFVTNMVAGGLGGAGGGGGAAVAGAKGGIGTLGKVFLVAEAIGLLAVLNEVKTGIEAGWKEQTAALGADLSNVIKTNDTAALQQSLAGIDEGIAKLKADPFAAALITGPVIAQLEADRAAVVAALEAQAKEPTVASAKITKEQQASAGKITKVQREELTRARALADRIGTQTTVRLDAAKAAMMTVRDRVEAARGSIVTAEQTAADRIVGAIQALQLAVNVDVAVSGGGDEPSHNYRINQYGGGKRRR